MVYVSFVSRGNNKKVHGSASFETPMMCPMICIFVYPNTSISPQYRTNQKLLLTECNYNLDEATPLNHLVKTLRFD